MNGIGARLKEYWKSDGVELSEGATLAQMNSFEERYNVRLPDDMRDYFAAANGFKQVTNWCDSNLFTFLSLEEVVPLSYEWSARIEASSYFVFVDYFISSHVYAIRLQNQSTSENPVFVVYNGDHPIRVTSTFSEFAEGYLAESRGILHP